jgi:ribose transport system ATP-binding protein
MTTDQATPRRMTADRETPLLQLSNIWKRFPGVVALRDVSFAATGGEVHALLGENGAGKSTLMGVAGGEIAPDEGTIVFGGEEIAHLTPDLAHHHGLAIVHQHPALLPDLTVKENMDIAIPADLRQAEDGATNWMRAQLDQVGCTAGLSERMEDVSVAQRALIELAKAVALRPRVLILDEPTAAIGADLVARVFQQVRAAAARGTAVIYISHRLAEVREIADRVTVMRDGAMQATSEIGEITDEEILRLIVGREVSTTFPPKGQSANGRPPSLQIRAMSGSNFHDIDFTVKPGEIVGLAGIAGNGQTEFLRAIAGLERASGEALLGEESLKLGRPSAIREAGVAYLPADRHNEGLLMSLTVRENAALSALPQFAPRGFVHRRQEVAAVERERQELKIRTASIETQVSTLSGGNQQKVVFARALLAKPHLVLAEEPTQGVDAGAHIEIYRILREIANSGVPVIVLSSDGLELEGLCDRVLVFSRGQIAGDLKGDQVTEENIGRTIVTATTRRREAAGQRKASSENESRARLVRFAKGDYAPSLVVAAAVVLLAIYTYSTNTRFLAAFNVTSMLTLLAALAFIAYGQLVVMLTGGIDISVGPLAGLVAVIASFFLVAGKSTLLMFVGVGLMLAASLAVGLANGTMVRLGRFTPVAATLAMYVGLQGISLLLRPQQGGFISASVVNAVQKTIGSVPIAFIVAAVLAVLFEYLLRYRQWGLGLRAAGSQETAAHRLGVRVNRTVIGAYMTCSAFTFLGGMMLMAQIGVGDPTQGVTYTLASITAVVLGGASLFGGRGSFIGALLGATLVTEIDSSTTFLNLSQAWQYWFVGILVLVAAAIYTQARRPGLRA